MGNSYIRRWVKRAMTVTLSVVLLMQSSVGAYATGGQNMIVIDPKTEETIEWTTEIEEISTVEEETSVIEEDEEDITIEESVLEGSSAEESITVEEDLSEATSIEEAKTEELVLETIEEIETVAEDRAENIETGVDKIIEISSADELLKIVTDVSQGISDYKDCVIQLNADIDLTGVTWTTIGNSSETPFRGSIQGNGHTISGMSSGVGKDGLIGYWDVQDECYIEDIAIENMQCYGKYSGGVVSTLTVADACIARLECVSVSGRVDGVSLVSGGLIGVLNIKGSGSAEIIGCNVDVSMYSDSAWNDAYASIGGIAGQVSDDGNGKLLIQNCTVDGALETIQTYGYCSSEAGGLIGISRVNNVSIERCGRTGRVSCKAYYAHTGGFIGNAGIDEDSSMKIENCYVNADVLPICTNGSSQGGGIIGYTAGTGGSQIEITNSYVTGSLGGSNNAAFVCWHSGNECPVVKNSYFDMNKLWLSKDNMVCSLGAFSTTWYTDNITNSGGLSTEEMLLQTSYQDWDFDTVWTISAEENGGYPTLQKGDDQQKNNLIIAAVERYTSDKELEEVLEIINSSTSDEERCQRLFEYYNYDNMLDVRERIIELGNMHDERWDYEGLIRDDMYLSWQYYDYLNNTPKGAAARVALYASGLVFNSELKDWLDLGTYLDSELPGIKKYKSMLEEFINTQSSSIEMYSYIKETEKFVNSLTKVCSETEKAEIINKLEEAPDIVTCKSIFNDFVAVKLNSGDETVTLEFDGEKPKFIEAMKKTDKIFKVTNIAVDGITGLMDVSSNLAAYEVYHNFLQEISDTEELPWELVAAAYQLNHELEEGYLTPITEILNDIRDQCLKETFDTFKFNELLKRNGWLDAIQFSAYCINQFVNIGELVINSCHTEGYAFLAMYYKDKLELCKQKFLSDKTEENAWAFYEAYVMLRELRIAGENKFLDMSKLEGGTVVDNASKLISNGGTIAGLLSDLCGYKDKEAAVNNNLELLKGFAFTYSIKDVDLPEEYKYLKKMIVECPVSVEILTSDGTQVCILDDGVEVEVTNEHGTFISFYRATTGDYVKIAYFNSEAPYIIRAVGQNAGVVTYSLAKTENHQTYTIEGFDKVNVSEKDIIHISTNEEKYTIDKAGDGKNDIEGELADKSKVYVQFDFQNGKQIRVEYVNENGIVPIPKTPIRDYYEFKGWFTEPDGLGTEFTKDTIVTKSITVYAKWENIDVLPEDIPEGGIENIPDGIWIAGIDDQIYTGSSIKQSFRVYDGKKCLRQNTDYTITYKNNKNAYFYTGKDYAAFEENLKLIGKRTKVGTFDPKKAPQVTVKMKGNYSGNKTIYFRINSADITGDTFKTDNLTVTYIGKRQTPAPKLTWNGKALKYGTDFYIPEYDAAKKDKKAFKDTGTYNLTITGKKNFTGEIPITLTISESAKQIAMNKVKVIGIKNVSWTGEQIVQTGFTVKYDKDVLSEEKGDYTIRWRNNRSAGIGTVTFTGTGKDEDGDGLSYIGNKTVSFKINGIAMNKVAVSGVEKSYIYTGTEIKPIAALTYMAGGNKQKVSLVKGIHYTVSYQKNVDKGTATILFTGLASGGYTGTKKVTFKITSAGVGDTTEGETTIENIQIAFADTENIQDGIYVAPYMKGGAKPEVIVTSGDKTLEAGKDYKVSYSNNKKPALSTDTKAPTVTVTGKGNYKGSKSETFTIEAKALSNENGITVVAKDKVESLKKNGYRQSFKVYDADGKALGNKDYDTSTVTYTLVQKTNEDGTVSEVNELLNKNSIVPAGSVIKITVQGKGIYAGGEASGTYRILEKNYDISKATIQINNQPYTGNTILITDQSQFKVGKVFIKMGNQKKELILGQDIEVVRDSYVKNVNKGTAKVTFRGINDFGGTKTVSFKIGARSITDFWKGIYAKMAELWN